jgi:leader peptidase (prepilin peptidase)/N-methyltransferase
VTADPVLVAFAGLLGAVLGSFLNVCILRWGADPKQSVVRPPSRCPKCGGGLRWYDNVPIVSWLLLRGRCRGCGMPISAQYPLVELGTALVWAFMAWRFGPGLEALKAAVFATILLGIAMTDARAYIIPHEFSIGGAAIGLAFAAALGGGFPGLGEAVLGACFGAGLVLLVGEVSELLAGQEAMGGGDCALMGMVGAFYGWEAVVPVVGVGAAISVVLYVLAQFRPRAPAAATAATAAGDPGDAAAAAAPALRWGMLLKLLLAGGVVIVAMIVAMRARVFGAVLQAAFDGIVGAGLVYYAAFLAPAGLQAPWLRVVGILGAAAGVAFGGGLSAVRLGAGVVVAAAALWYARRAEVAESPATAEELTAGGYLPFGVGLSLAAGLLVLVDAYPAIRAGVAEYLQLLGVS